MRILFLIKDKLNDKEKEILYVDAKKNRYIDMGQ
jgi:hypothetical protein